MKLPAVVGEQTIVPSATLPVPAAAKVRLLSLTQARAALLEISVPLADTLWKTQGDELISSVFVLGAGAFSFLQAGTDRSKKLKMAVDRRMCFFMIIGFNCQNKPSLPCRKGKKR